MKQIIKTAAILGAVAPLITYTCILLAIISYSEFSWTNNALSDLGIVPGVTMTLFNSGLIIGGILFTIFAFALFTYLRKTLIGRIGSIFFIIASISMICVGIFNEHIKPIHFIVSVTLFSFMALALIVISCNSYYTGQKRLSIFTLSLGLASAIVWILEYTIWYFPHVAIPEFVTGLMGTTWVLVMVNKMLKDSTSNQS